MSDDTNQRPTLKDDLIPGGKNIAGELNLTPRQFYHLAANGKLPVFKIGKQWNARRSTLIRCIEELEAGFEPLGA